MLLKSLKKFSGGFFLILCLINTQSVLAGSDVWAKINVTVVNNSSQTVSLQSNPCGNCVMTSSTQTALKSGGTASFTISGPNFVGLSSYTANFIFAATSSMGGQSGCSLAVACQQVMPSENTLYCGQTTATASLYTSGNYNPNWLPNCNQRPVVTNADASNSYTAQVNYTISSPPTEKRS